MRVWGNATKITHSATRSRNATASSVTSQDLSIGGRRLDSPMMRRSTIGTNTLIGTTLSMSPNRRAGGHSAERFFQHDSTSYAKRCGPEVVQKCTLGGGLGWTSRSRAPHRQRLQQEFLVGSKHPLLRPVRHGMSPGVGSHAPSVVG